MKSASAFLFNFLLFLKFPSTVFLYKVSIDVSYLTHGCVQFPLCMCNINVHTCVCTYSLFVIMV